MSCWTDCLTDGQVALPFNAAWKSGILEADVCKVCGMVRMTSFRTGERRYEAAADAAYHGGPVSDDMATTNHERVGKALELLKAGLGPFVDREVQTAVRAQRIDAATLRRFVDDPLIGDRPATDWDVAVLLKLMCETWNDVFRPAASRRSSPSPRR